MRNCRSVKTVRDLRHLRPLGVLMVGLRRKYTGREFRTSGLGSEKKKKTLKIARKKSNAFTLNRRGEGNIGPKKDPLSYAKSILSRILVLQDNNIALGRNF